MRDCDKDLLDEYLERWEGRPAPAIVCSLAQYERLERMLEEARDEEADDE
jgi:hypothetical protein